MMEDQGLTCAANGSGRPEGWYWQAPYLTPGATAARKQRGVSSARVRPGLGYGARLSANGLMRSKL